MNRNWKGKKQGRNIVCYGENNHWSTVNSGITDAAYLLHNHHCSMGVDAILYAGGFLENQSK